MIRTIKAELEQIVSRRGLLALLVLAVLAAQIGSLGTIPTGGFWYQFVYWMLVVASAILLAGVLDRAMPRLFGQERKLLGSLAAVALMTALLTPVLWGLTTGFLVRNTGDKVPSVRSLGEFVLTFSLGIAVLRHTVFGPEPDAASPAPLPTEATPAPRLASRLPETAPGPILRLTVRDHFVDVVTARQTFAIRMRFRDAIAEMDAVRGHCTHRSHWVVTAAIAGVERQAGGRVGLRLTNGDLVPVSRKYRPELEAAGIV